MTSEKPSNPKDSVGIRKAPMSTVPAEVMLEVGLAMLEGARKYGRHNYRAVGVRASVYYDATMRHLMAWWEGQDIDPESGLSHLVKAMACLVVARDAIVNDRWEDDRPPRLNQTWMYEANCRAGEIIDRHPNPKDAYTEAMFDYGDPESMPMEYAGFVDCGDTDDCPLPAYCDTEGHEYAIAPGETAYKCICCGAVPVLEKATCEHDWMLLSMPGFEGKHCRKCGAKKEGI